MSYTTQNLSAVSSTGLDGPGEQVEDGYSDGFIDSLGYITTGFSSESRTGLGINVKGIVLSSDGSPLSGSVGVISDGETLSSSGVFGKFNVSSSPPNGVELGSGSGLTEIGLIFSPSSGGLPITREDIGLSYDLGEVIYGAISGEVLDYNGDPVTGANISGPGLSTSTDDKGEYRIPAPGGENVTISCAGSESQIDTSSGSEVTENFQYSGLEVTVQLPTGDGIPNAIVVFQGSEESVTTGGDGKALFKRALNNFSGDIAVFGGDVIVPTQTPGPGSLASETVESGAGFKGRVTDARTGGGLGGVDVEVEGGEFGSGSTDNDGSFVAGSKSAGVLRLAISKNDRRYQRVDVVRETSDGEVENVNVEIERKENIGTMG